MAIPEPTDNITAQEQAFNQMKYLFTQLQQAFPHEKSDTISMGMSDDMASAIRCGSTMVRIGTAISVNANSPSAQTKGANLLPAGYSSIASTRLTIIPRSNCVLISFKPTSI